MKIKLMILVLLVMATATLFIVKPKKAYCAWCPSYTCYGPNSCGSDKCKCISKGYNGGTCISIE